MSETTSMSDVAGDGGTAGVRATEAGGAEVPSSEGGFVVVGVSGSSGSPMALRWTLDAAHLRGLRLVAVRAYKVPSASSTVRPTPSRMAGGDEVLREEALDSLTAHVRAALGADADEVELRAVRGGRRKVLVEASLGAALLVVDAPRAIERTRNPAFARTLVYQAQCPVVVMPPHVAETEAQPWIEGRRTPHV